MSILAGIVNILTGGIVDKVVDLGKAYFNKQITEAELRAQVEIAVTQSASAALESVQATVRSSPVIQRAYAFTVWLLCAVLAWYWLGASAFKVATGVDWPVPPIDPMQAHVLLGALLVGSPLVFRR